MKKGYFALVDCNNFFASCERVFRPDLENKPVVVLSSNDGCAVARSNEVKALGVPMGAPYFKWKAVLDSANAFVFSSNFALYSDISRRISNTLKGEAPDIEVYSVDESFVFLNVKPELASKWGAEVRAKILKEIGVPVSVGLAPTKTLAKAASEYAKKHPETGGVSIIPDVESEEYRQVLGWLDIGDVWGIGRALAPKLRSKGIYKTLSLASVSTKWAKEQMTSRGEKTLRELQGEVWYKLNEDNSKDQKSMMVTRSFSGNVRNHHELEVAVASFVARAAGKLHRQNQLAAAITVFARTSLHKDEKTIVSATRTLEVPTSDNATLTKEALSALKEAFVPGVSYRKAGIVINQLLPETAQQMSLLGGATPEDIEKQNKKADALEAISNRYGKGVIMSGSALNTEDEKKWKVSAQLRSREYTTKWNELAVVKAL